MRFSRWAVSGSVEGKSERTGRQENLRLQRVHTNVGSRSFASLQTSRRTREEEEKRASCEPRRLREEGKRGR